MTELLGIAGVILGIAIVFFGFVQAPRKKGHKLRVDKDFYNFFNGARSDRDFADRRAALDTDVASKNMRSGRSFFGRPEWEVSTGIQHCDECGIVPMDLKRVLDPHTGQPRGVFCSRCVRKYL